MNLELKDKNALVTGASTGIGRAIAEAFSREGARVAINARNPESLASTANAIREATGGHVVAIPGDVASSDDVKRIVAETEENLGTISALVCNAGGPPAGPFHTLDEQAFWKALGLNLMSTVNLCRAATQRMIEAGTGGAIVALTSISVKQPLVNLMLSNTARAGVTGFCKSLANELAPHNIRVNSVGPGFTTTDRLEELKTKLAKTNSTTPEAIEDQWKANIPLGRLGSPEEIADTVVFLSSARASYITGTMTVVDGGFCRSLL